MSIAIEKLALSLDQNGVNLDLPKRYAKHIKHYLGTEYAVLTIGNFEGFRSCEILFEDNSDVPRALKAEFPSQVEENHQFSDMEKTVIKILCEGVQRGELSAYIRYRDTLPCMEKIYFKEKDNDAEDIDSSKHSPDIEYELKIPKNRETDPNARARERL
jgi:hypothetical protein